MLSMKLKQELEGDSNQNMSENLSLKKFVNDDSDDECSAEKSPITVKNVGKRIRKKNNLVI